MDLGLTDKIALVTGASSGIGAATARLLAAERADVLIAYRSNAEGAARTADAVRAVGRRAWCIEMDVADASAVDRAMRSVAGLTDGALDVLVLNAGQNVVVPLAEMTPEQWDDVVRVNLSGTFYVLRAARPLLRKGASVVMVASVAAHTGAPHHAHYAAAKAGIVNLARSAARELAPDVRVNCVAPGLTRTPMGLETLAGRDDDYAASRLLARRLADPDEIARAIVFIASPAASFVYGATLDVNGGRHLR